MHAYIHTYMYESMHVNMCIWMFVKPLLLYQNTHI